MVSRETIGRVAVALLMGACGPVRGALDGNFRAPAEEVREVVPGFLWIEAEGFSDYGNWKLDTQFTHKMGSAYLLAAGALRPIGAAKTSVPVPRAGKWTAWVRTKDWVPEHHPGRFRLSLNGRPGRELGASGRSGWTWERAGDWQLDVGRVALALEDLTGAFARCDAVLLTTDAGYVPPEDAEALASERQRLTGADPTVRDGGDFDVVVVGAGTGGMGAALAAALQDVRVALVHDRPVLGGNASMELGVPVDGAAVSHPYAREGGICEEAELRRRLRPDGGGSQLLSGIFDEMCAELPNLSVFANERVLSVAKDGERIASVLARNTVTGRRTRFGGRIFVDATGDGWIGHFAGAKMMYGREAKAEYDEWPAPDVRDDLTMSGCLMAGSCLGYEHRKADGPRPFATPAWADVLPKGFTRKHVFNADSQWWTEHAGRFDDCADPEGARDQLVRINVAYWGWLKNSWSNRATIANEELVSIAYRNGRREGMRIRGDYVLTANDCLKGRVFPDRVTYGGWPLDTHDPLGMENPTDDTWGYWKHHPDSPIYTIPFRCLYSVNVPNLMMAGRNISATHIALGSTRVQATCLTLGQAAGTAAAEMVRKGLEPRAYGERHIAELQQLLLKNDQYIPHLANEDPGDLVRRATVSATSYLRSEKIAIGHESLTVDVHAALPLDRPRATLFKRGDLRTLGAFRCNLRAFAGHSPSVTAIVYTASSPSGRAADRRQVGLAVARPVSHWQNWARFVPEKPIRLEEPYAWVQLLPVENVTWSRGARRIDVGARIAEGDGDWKVTEDFAMAFCPEDGFRVPIDARAEKVADGVSRPVGDEWHGWVSDPRAGLPQTLSVSFDSPHDVTEVRLTFDSHLEKMHPSGMPMPPRLVRDYVLEGFDGKAWRKLDAVRDNDRRLRVHRFPAQTLAGFRVRVDATWGDASARIFEVRAYERERARDVQFWTAEDYFNEAVVVYSSSTNVETSIIARRRVRKADSNDCPRVEIPVGDTKRIRWIRAPGLRNVRDIGGWTGLRAGRVYRGSALMWAEQSNVAYAVEAPMTRDVLVNRLGIRAELDLRGEKERKVTKDGVPRHGLPEFGIRPVCVPLGGYMDAFKDTNAYRRAMQAFADPANFPIYVHCAGGADRTGTVIFLLEALCGVPEWQMDIDYEITSMASVFGRRNRTDTGMLCYKSFKDALKERYAGTTVNEKVEDYCRRTLGLTDDEIRSIRRNLLRPHEIVPDFVFAEAEDFDDFGRWRLDTQFTHKMGSAYLIAPGVCSPIGSARTTVDLPRAGRWRAWVRTKDWLPEFSPGAFALSVGGTRSRVLGSLRRDGWRWEDAGTFELGAGPLVLSLDDLSGAFARCDAVLLTTDLAYVPPEEGEALAAERARLKGLPTGCADRGMFDVVVVGAGPAGVPAAIAAARGGAKVALVGDRPVLGGNASDEIGVNMCGAAITHVTARETGLAEEAVCERTRHPGPGMSNPYRVLAEGEKNLTVFYNERVTAARAEGGCVLSVDCRNTLTGARSRLAGRLFVDATGDGWLGYFAGAEYREGREGRTEFGENCAPDEPDRLTMSGLLHEPGIGVCYRAEETEGPVAYRTPCWARVLPEGFERPVFNLRGQWWIEHSGLFDDCADPERARDELIRISFAYWGWLKNESRLRDKARNFRLEEIPVLTGRREARRLVGDYILTEHDCLQARIFPDAVAYGGWPLDTHDPMGMSAPRSDGYWTYHPDVPIYTIPYRCLYSKNIVNLFMAGRDISGTHIAMGSARVQQTCSVVGQAVGTAAALCLRHGLSPRELGRTRIGELQQRLMRDDAYIPGFANADPLDLARGAKVSASSSVGFYARPTPCARRYDLKGGEIVYTNATPAAVIDGIARGVNGEAHAWVSGPGLPQWIRLDFPEMITAGEVRLTFDTNLEPRALPRPTDPVLVRAYDLEGTEDGENWFPLAAEGDNYRRLRVHRFAPRRVKAIRLTVRGTYGAQQAFVNEIRVYAAGAGK